MTEDDRLKELLVDAKSGRKDVARVLAIRCAYQLQAGEALAADLAAWCGTVLLAAVAGDISAHVEVSSKRGRGQSEELQRLQDGTSRGMRIAAIGRLLTMSEWTDADARELLTATFVDQDPRTIRAALDHEVTGMKELKPTWEKGDDESALDEVYAMAIGTFFIRERPPEWTELRDVRNCLVSRGHPFVRTKYFAEYFALKNV